MTQAPNDTPSPNPTRPNSTGAAPSRKRFAALVFCFVYPLVTVLLYAAIPLTQSWSIWQRNLIVVPIIVLAMVYAIIPFIQKRLKHLL